MRRGMMLGWLLLAEAFVLPGLLLRPGSGAEAGELPSPAAQESVTAAENTEEPAAESEPAAEDTRTVRVKDGDTVTEQPLEDYLWGVVAAEMPAEFEEEALKAQAVAARTETIYRCEHPAQKHPDADICTDHTCCQAWISREAARARWGEEADAYEAKITEAVADTAGRVLTYDGAVIQAVYHSSSAGHTLSAAQVWGAEVPYLCAVDSPEGAEVPNYYSVVTVTAEDFNKAVHDAHGELPEDPANWPPAAETGDGGEVQSVTVEGVTLTPAEVRSLFGLRSPRFTVETGADSITFYVTGYGHGVGMSQYGANTYAKEGWGYADILTWYYTGVTLAPLEN